MVHFLQLPIEDDLAELQPQQPIGMAVKGSGPALAPAEQPIPFADTSNPIMAQVTVKELLLSPSCQLCNGRRNVSPPAQTCALCRCKTLVVVLSVLMQAPALMCCCTRSMNSICYQEGDFWMSQLHEEGGLVQVAFLASVVSPKVAAAAAQRALEVLASEDVSTVAEDDYLAPESPTPAETGSTERCTDAEAPAEIKEAGAKAEEADTVIKDEAMHDAAPAGSSAAPPSANGAPFFYFRGYICPVTLA